MSPNQAPTSFSHEDLLVIDELKVGPVRLTPNRLSAKYRVTNGDQVHTNTLVFSYPEAVFDPADPTDQNLASLIAAQVALNYGLFCRTITFDGLYDGIDHRFLQDMLENTSREIYVNKLLLPNQFLTGPVADLQPEKRKSYTNAALQFVNTGFPAHDWHWAPWLTDANRFCVLSSGGKDSLLSYGLLKELGKEVHAIFGNESGRHWFTALNGYRYQKERDPFTSKVWMNSDRLFNWMLGHLPFVRPDFARLRADDYPIRLWTVAVFLFGAMPFLKKRGIQHLVIGDEYDTTVRSKHEGIPHYNGLYDQSRYFDEALTRFFIKKGWSVRQFSVLRPLSELLIVSILAGRYPDLQTQQISSHAAHEREGRIYPCGKCEKCRRVVGMLTAIGADPQRCGYSPEQIEQCLQELPTHKVKQIGPDASQLYHLLGQKLDGELGAPFREKGKPYPQVMKLRFDRERSPRHNLPAALRQPLYDIFLQYADGAVRRDGRKWIDLTLSESSERLAPYPFEQRPAPATYDSLPPLSERYRWAELTWEEAEQRLQQVDIALLPVGAIEQHGPHLPLDLDAFDAAYLAERVAAACGNPKPLVLPLVPYGVSYHHQAFKGTISISNEAMAKFIYDIGICAARNGIRKLVIINGHGDNAPTLSYAAQMINRDAQIFVCVDTGETSDADIGRITQTPNDIHAGEVETSTALAIRPQLVHMDRAVDSTLKFSSRYLDFSTEHSVPWYVHTQKISETGVMGNPTLASAEKGARIWEIMIGHLVALVEELKGMTLEEVYQKRY